MSDDALRYERMVERALRGVVREALTVVADRGLPGNHHFYITFRTDYPGVLLAEHLHERFPSEMTIVIQHQFWGLRVDSEGFEVTLSFNDKPERLQIPLAAVTAFADPSVRFGLQFDAGQESVDPASPPMAEAEASNSETPPADSRDKALAPVDDEAKLPASQSDGEKDEGRTAGGDKAGRDKKPPKKEAGEVVSLDAFRKK